MWWNEGRSISLFMCGMSQQNWRSIYFLLARTSAAGVRTLLAGKNAVIVYALDTRFRAYLCIKRLLRFIILSVGTLQKIGGFLVLEQCEISIATCKYIRNAFKTSFLRTIDIEEQPRPSHFGIYYGCNWKQRQHMFMVQRKVFYKGPWCSQGPFHSSVCQYNCQENFVWMQVRSMIIQVVRITRDVV